MWGTWGLNSFKKSFGNKGLVEGARAGKQETMKVPVALKGLIEMSIKDKLKSIPVTLQLGWVVEGPKLKATLPGGGVFISPLLSCCSGH